MHGFTQFVWSEDPKQPRDQQDTSNVEGSKRFAVIHLGCETSRVRFAQ